MNTNWLINLLKDIPTTAKYKFELEKLIAEHSELKSKVSVLESELLAANEKIRELEKDLADKSHTNLLKEQQKVDKLNAENAENQNLF